MTDQPHKRLQEEVVRLRGDVAELMERCTSLEQEVGTLSNLYVASQRLHETLDRTEVLRAIEEIVINLVGSEELAIFEVRDASLSLISSFGIEREHYARRPLDVGPMAQAVRSGKTVVLGDETRSAEEPRLTACVPLRLRDRVIGVIAVFGLLPQKPRLEAVDHDLFELLTTAAATALHNAAAPRDPDGEQP